MTLGEIVEPNAEMLRLRTILDGAGIEWHDNSDEVMCRTSDTGGNDWKKFSAFCGRWAYGAIELWTGTMQENKQDPIGLDTAEEAFAMIQEEVSE